LVSVLLFIPHIYWQYQHAFPSIQYHLFERSGSYKIPYTFEYIGGQLLLAGPFLGWLFIIGAFKYQSKNLLERALKFSVIGIYSFFFISTFKGRVEANWTVPALTPLIILSHQYLCDQKKWQRILYRTVPLSLLVIFFIRFYLITDNKFITALNTNEFEQNKTWAGQIKNISKGLPVVFINSYQKASKYWFYSGIPAFSLNTPEYRRNNFNYWPIENAMQGKPVYAMWHSDPLFFTDSLKTSAGIIRGKYIDSFYSYSHILLKAVDELAFNAQKRAIVTVSSSMPLDTTSQIQLYVNKQKEHIKTYKLQQISADTFSKKYTLITYLPVLLPAGEYTAKLAISTALPGYSTLNSTNIKLSVK
jgi:hypothetical protein